jgi:hypothetical protein
MRVIGDKSQTSAMSMKQKYSSESHLGTNGILVLWPGTSRTLLPDGVAAANNIVKHDRLAID